MKPGSWIALISAGCFCVIASYAMGQAVVVWSDRPVVTAKAEGYVMYDSKLSAYREWR